MEYRNQKTRHRMAVLSFLALALLSGCRKEYDDFQGQILTIAEVGYGGIPTSRAVVGGDGSTAFYDGDLLGLFLRGEGYPDVDNRPVKYVDSDGINKKWVIQGEDIPLHALPAQVTGYFPYSASLQEQMAAMPLVPGVYDVNVNDFVWQRDTVDSGNSQAILLNMSHAMTRVKLSVEQAENASFEKVSALEIADSQQGDAPGSIYTAGQIDLTQDDPRAVGTTRGPLTDLTEKQLDRELSYDLLLIPVESISEGTLMLRILVDGELLQTPFPTDLVKSWKAGQAYKYDVTIHQNTLSIKYGGGDVQDWDNNGWEVEVNGTSEVK